jgi:hypothetical protein
MAPGIQVVVDTSRQGFTIRWFEQGLERHVWVAQSKFEEFLASGQTVYVDTPAVAADRVM